MKTIVTFLALLLFAHTFAYGQVFDVENFMNTDNFMTVTKGLHTFEESDLTIAMIETRLQAIAAKGNDENLSDDAASELADDIIQLFASDEFSSLVSKPDEVYFIVERFKQDPETLAKFPLASPMWQAPEMEEIHDKFQKDPFLRFTEFRNDEEFQFYVGIIELIEPSVGDLTELYTYSPEENQNIGSTTLIERLLSTSGFHQLAYIAFNILDRNPEIKERYPHTYQCLLAKDVQQAINAYKENPYSFMIGDDNYERHFK